MNNYILLSEKKWHIKLFEFIKQKRSSENWTLINNKEDFNLEKLNQINPKKIFIPHWSYIIPQQIYNNFECVVFHMTDLPYGRGGSPLQNLIVKGHKKTKITALKVEKGLDTGGIYLKKDLSLDGTAQEIFERSSLIIGEMIVDILDKNIVPIPQKGTATVFKRRTPEMSNISNLKTIDEVYDYIRMLDAEGYPHAFIENDNFKFIFTKAKNINNKTIEANVRIIKK